MSLDVMKQALEALEEIADEVFSPYDNKLGDAILALRAAIKQVQEPVVLNGGRLTQYPDGSIGVGTPAKPDQWQGLTDEEIKAPIQRAMQHFGFDPTQYSLGGAATIGFLGLVKEIEWKLKEKNT